MRERTYVRLVIWAAVLLALLVLFTPARCRADSPLVGAAWCTKAKEGAPGCDAGVGASLAHRGRAHLVAVIGTKTLGAGGAWVLTPPEHEGPVLAVALGVVAPYSEAGIDGDLHLALGCTLSFGRGGR